MDDEASESEDRESLDEWPDDQAAPEAEAYKIRLTGPGLSLERAIDGETAYQVVGLLISPGGAPPQNRTTHWPRGAGAHSPQQPTRVAVGEYVRGTGAKRYPAKILSIGAWIEDHQGVQSFTRDEVKAQFRNLGEPPPQNMSRDFQTAVSNGWLSPDSTQANAYWVTNTGREAIAAQFAGETKTRTRRARPKRKSADSRSGNDEAES
jgi:hypothetical protein